LVPSPPILKRFDAHASALAAQAHSHNQQSRSLAGLRDTLLPKLISGEICIKDADRYAAEVLP
jgi:type I restriction enzyme S subunit